MNPTPSPRLQPPEPSPSAGPNRLRLDASGPAGGWPLFDSAGCKAHEIAAAALLPPHTLMQRAGTSVARLALALAPHASDLLVVAGRGHNGGDGLEAAAHLRQIGRSVRVLLLEDPRPLPADAATALEQARQAGVPIHPWTPEATHQSAGLLIDAVLGRGLRGAATGAAAAAIQSILRHPTPVLSVDLPSGLPADTGQPTERTHGHPPSIVTATWTLSLLGLSPGLFTGLGRPQAGQVWWDDLQTLPTQAPVARLLTQARANLLHPPSPDHLHKGSRGDVVIVGGDHGMTGAAWLAARRAVQSGAGRVYVHLLDPDAPRLDTLHPELMHRATLADLHLETATVVAGCGGGSAIAHALPELLTRSARLVLDADGLNAVAHAPLLAAQLRQRSATGQPTVLTPHPLEAARLLGTSAAHVQSNRLQAARTLADRFQAVVVLKGSGSVIAAPGTLPWINPTGNAALATPGSGDVLAGWIGALWSRQIHTPAMGASAESDPPLLDGTLAAASAAATAVFNHGHRAERLSPSGEAIPASALAQAPG